MSANLRVSIPAVLIASLLALPTSGNESNGYSRDTRAYNLAHGRVVFKENCLRCHESGRKGAPVAGDADDWRERLGQPLDTLIAHAIQGHGDMPARGEQDIPDQDVAAAVAYITDRTRLILATDTDVNDLPPPAAGPDRATPPEVSDETVVHMFLMLLGKDRWK